MSNFFLCSLEHVKFRKMYYWLKLCVIENDFGFLDKTYNVIKSKHYNVKNLKIRCMTCLISYGIYTIIT